MKLTVDELLQLVHDAIATESDSFGKKAALRRLTRLRSNIAPMSHLQADIPEPKVVTPTVDKPKRTRKKRVVVKEQPLDTAASAQTTWEV